MRRLVILRPEPGASISLAAARALGLEAAGLPLFAIEPIAWNAPDHQDFDALLLTSANACRFAGEQLAELRRLPAYTVGETTAESARIARLTVAATGNRGVESLLESLEPGLRLLHLCGEHFRPPRQPRQRFTHLPVYRAAEIADPLLEPIAGAVVAVHSPRAAKRLAQLTEARSIDRSTIAIAAISPEAAAAAWAGWEQVGIAEEPTDSALLALAARLCEKASRR